MTDEQNQREEVEKMARTTLEDKVFQKVVGSNHVRSNPFLYGQLGVAGGESTYESLMNEEEVKKVQSEIYAKRKAKGKRLGVFGEPAYPMLYEASTEIIEEIELSKKLLPLKALESIVKSVSEGFDAKLPESFKDITIKDLIEKAENKVKLTENEKGAFEMFKVMSEAYTRGCGLNSCGENYFADLNAEAEQISKKYSPTPNEGNS